MAPRWSKTCVVAVICAALSVQASLQVLRPAVASAADPPASSSAAEPSRSKGAGFAVLTAGPSADATWPVAQAVYRSSLRPPALDEPRARVLAGEAAGDGATSDARDLAELRAGIKGDDAASRQLLSAIADKLALEGVVVVFAEGDALEVRVWLRDTGAFDAARYRRDAQNGWAPLVASLERSTKGAPLAPLAPPTSAPAPTVTPAFAIAPAPTRPRAPDGDGRSSKPFYLSPWFWGAIGAAVFAGGAVYLATRESDNGQIRLQMRVPQ